MNKQGQFRLIVAIIILVIAIIITLTIIYLWWSGLQTRVQTPSSEALVGAFNSFSKI